MRFLVLSDPHGNAIALAAVLEASQGRWERAVCLGDLVGYGPHPNEVIDQIREIASTVIRGNHDKGAAGLSTLDDFNAVARYALEWTRTQLRPDNLRYLQKLPAGPQVDGALAWFMVPFRTRRSMFSPLRRHLKAYSPRRGPSHFLAIHTIRADFPTVTTSFN